MTEQEMLAAFRSAFMAEFDSFRGAVLAEIGKLRREMNELRAVADRIADRQLERDHDEDRYRRRVRALEEEVERVSNSVEGPNWKRDPRDITGVHALRDLAELKKDRHDSMIWWKRQRWIWGVGLLIAVVAAVTVACVTATASRVERVIEQTPAAQKR